MNLKIPFVLIGESLELYRKAIVERFIDYPIYITVALLLIVSQALTQNNAWQKVSSPSTYRFDQLAINSTSDIFAVSGTNIFRSTDNGNYWKTIRANYWAPTLAAIGPNNDLFAIDAGIIFKSTNKGDTWETWDSLAPTFVFTLRFNPNGHIFIGGNGNLRSKDNGKHWETIPLEYQALDFIFLKNGDILAGVTSGAFPNPPQYIYRSTDNGDSWQKVLNAEKTSGWSMAVSNNGDAFAAPVEYDSSLGGVYRSTDSGVSWSRVNNGLPARKVNSIISTSTGKLFASIKGSGVFQSTDDGDTWTDFNDGLDNLQTECLAMDSSDILYLGTDQDSTVDAAIYKFTLPTSVNDKSLHFPNCFTLYQNYPNPFNPSTTISFSLPSKSFVSIKVFDLVGREIATIISEELSAGNHSRQWNASGMPSGVYFYRIQARTFTETKKLVLLK